MLMSPDSSSADPDPIASSRPSGLAMIQVPECTQSHGGSVAVKPQHHAQIMDYKKLEPSLFMSPTKLHHQPAYQKPSMGPKTDEDMNLGNDSCGVNRTGLIGWESEWESEWSTSFELLTQFFMLGRLMTLNTSRPWQCSCARKKVRPSLVLVPFNGEQESDGREREGESEEREEWERGMWEWVWEREGKERARGNEWTQTEKNFQVQCESNKISEKKKILGWKTRKLKWNSAFSSTIDLA